MVTPLHCTSVLGWTLTLGFPFATAAHAELPASGAASRQISASHAISASAIAGRHWRAIAQGDVPALMGDYRPEAVFHWKEGAFEGDHVGAEAIRAVWIKFARLRSPLTLTVRNVREKRGSQGSRIVTAEVTFRNAHWTYPLSYRLVFRGVQIVEETWQIAESEPDPGLTGA